MRLSRKKENAPSLESKRVSVRKDGTSIPQPAAYDMVRDDPEQWRRGCRAWAWSWVLLLAVYMMMEVLACH